MCFDSFIRNFLNFNLEKKFKSVGQFWLKVNLSTGNTNLNFDLVNFIKSDLSIFHQINLINIMFAESFIIYNQHQILIIFYSVLISLSSILNFKKG